MWCFRIMMPFCENWFQILFILGVMTCNSEGTCFKHEPVTLSCGNQFITRISIKYQRPGQTPVQCCNSKPECHSELREKCEGETSCVISKSEVELSLRCYSQQQSPISICIYYNCSKDDETFKGTLPASGNPDNTGDSGVSSMVVVPIIVALAILIIVAAIFGFVLYRRRNSLDKTNKEEDIKGEENAGIEDAYNTIPADYGVTVQHTYHVLETENSDLKHETEKSDDIEQRDSKNYCKIVLDEDSKDDNNDSDYDKTNNKKQNKLSKVLLEDNVHSYDHFMEHSDDYNRTKPNDDQHLDKNYSHFESWETGDYSHLNETKEEPRNTSENDYNHLQTKSTTIRRVDSYEQPILRGLNDDSDIKSGEANTDHNAVKRRDIYEDPVSVHVETVDGLKNQSDENILLRDNYEEPIGLPAHCPNTHNGSSIDRLKGRYSYEEPVPLVSPDM